MYGTITSAMNLFGLKHYSYKLKAKKVENPTMKIDSFYVIS